jgi:hypothetical protein
MGSKLFSKLKSVDFFKKIPRHAASERRCLGTRPRWATATAQLTPPSGLQRPHGGYADGSMDFDRRGSPHVPFVLNGK